MTQRHDVAAKAGSDRPASPPPRGTILFVGPLPDPITGQSLACQVLVDELRRHYRVEVVNLSKDGFRQGMSSFRRVLDILSIAYRVWRLLRSVDVMYFTVSESYAGNAKDLLIYLVCLSQLPRMMIHLHGGAGMREIMRRSHPLWQWLNRFFLRRIGSVVILGPRHAPIFAGAVPAERLHVVPNFAQDELFTNEVAIDAKFGAGPPLRLLFLSNLLPGKGHRELVASLDLLDESTRAQLQVDIAGGFETEHQKAEFLASLRGRPNVNYHGTVRGEAKRRLFAQAHLFCLPTYYPYEGQPISILEAYASGCAVITTDHSGILDVFDDGINGYCVEMRSAESLAQAIRRAAVDPAAVRAMARANLRIASECYRTGHYTATLMRLLDELMPPQTGRLAQPRSAALE